MVCPLRFVVAGLSALIVLFIAVDVFWSSSAAERIGEEEEQVERSEREVRLPSESPH
jgi:hypothetical protein